MRMLSVAQQLDRVPARRQCKTEVSTAKLLSGNRTATPVESNHSIGPHTAARRAIAEGADEAAARRRSAAELHVSSNRRGGRAGLRHGHGVTLSRKRSSRPGPTVGLLEADATGICYRVDDMAEVALFHHALGLTPGVVEFADRLRGAGHVVHTPDLYDGRKFDTLEEGIDHAQQIGFGELIDRGVHAVGHLSAELVYAGFSLGVLPAQKLAQTRPGAQGALLFYSCVPISEFGSAWPAGVPVQIHGMDADPIFIGEGDVDAARALVESTGQAELFLYPGDQHYFADSTLPSYDADAAAVLLDRTLAFLRAVE